MKGYLKIRNCVIDIVEVLGESNSDGELKKWVVLIDGEKYYLKSSSKVGEEEMYECESECICCRLAKLLGMENIVWYDLDFLVLNGETIKICISKDFIGGANYFTYAKLNPIIAKFHGHEKYDKVISIEPSLKKEIDEVLVFDAVVANTDRHLNNLAILSGVEGNSIPLFDNGASLYSNSSVKSMKLMNKLSFGFQKCKPFYDTVGQQLSLVGEVDLKRVNIHDVFKIVGDYLPGRRAKYVKELLLRNLTELDLLRWDYDESI